MSRSNPSENVNPNPAVRRFEWNGEKGIVRYYNKEAKQNVDVGADFTFLLLDQLGAVRGWHDASDSGIYSNEVKDTTQEVLVVKAFKGGTLAEGLYRDIKDRVGAQGGQFVAVLYVAFKDDHGTLQVGTLGMKGAALKSWMDFKKQEKTALYEKAIRVKGFEEGKKGKVIFRTPKFFIKDVDPSTHAQAMALDAQLQDFFATYFKKPKREQVAAHEDPTNEPTGEDEPVAVPDYNDDHVPF